MSESYTIGGDTLHKCDNPNWGGQTFTPKETHILEYIDLEMRGPLIMPRPVVLVFYADAHHKPWGDYLSRNRVITEQHCSLFTTGRVRFSMTPTKLNEHDKYVIIVQNHPPLLGSSAYWQYDQGDATYPGGLRISTDDSGETWTVHYNDDHIFAEFGTPPLPKPEPPPPIDNFAVLDIDYIHLAIGLIMLLPTATPCHLTCYYTDKKPLKHHTERIIRGLTVPWGVYFCFVGWKAVEQNEPGDTLYHTFTFPDWEFCQTKWFTFRGEVDNILSPSVGPIFIHHHPGVIAGIEEQTLYDGVIFVLPTRNKCGQRLTITNRRVAKLAFVLERYGGGWTSDISFTIRRVSDDSIIATKVWGLESSVPSAPTWLEVTFDTPVLIDEEVRITVDWPGAMYRVSNNLRFHFKMSDVKPDEIFTWYQDGAWVEPWPWDAAYRYTYYE